MNAEDDFAGFTYFDQADDAYDELKECEWRAEEVVNYAPVRYAPVRAQVLDEARALITGDRNKSYGSPTSNFDATAALWNVQFGHLLGEGEQFTASHIAQAMILLKMARMIAGPKQDHWIDIAGYAGCGAETEAS